MIDGEPSKLLYDRLYRRRPLSRKIPEDLDPIAIPNVAGGWDYFLFGTEFQLRHWFGWVYSKFGNGSLSFDDGGLSRKGLLPKRKEHFQTIYMNFFRAGKRYRNNPAYIWIWGCCPLGTPPLAPEQTCLVHEKKLIDFSIRYNDQRWGPGPVSLRLMESRAVDLAPGFFAVPEKKLSCAITYKRSREIEVLRTGRRLLCQHHHEIQVGTDENAQGIKAGDFWYNHDEDVVPMRQTAAGVRYHHGYVMRLIRLGQGYSATSGERVGASFEPYMMEEVYVTIRGTNGCVTKVGAVWSSDFDAHAGYHVPLMLALRELERQ